jgi:hypothetical protein
MTTELQRSRIRGGAHGTPPTGPGKTVAETPGSRRLARAVGSHAGRRKRLLADHPAWPLVALLAGYPLWWALGLAGFIFIILAIPMLARLYAWHVGGRRLRVPPGFSIWLLFLVVLLAGAATLPLTAPGTVASPLSSRMIAFGDRTANYLAITVLLLFACNLTPAEFSRRQLTWLLALVGIYATIGGLAGVAAPHFQFTSPLAFVLPHSFTTNTLIQAWMHPALAQIQGVLGSPKGRPKAPFDYTNEWGNSLTLLLPWLLVWAQTPRQRRLALGIIAAAFVPIIYSLNRGVWLGVAFSVIYLAIRLAARGRVAVLGAVCGGFALLAVVALATPLHTMVGQRLTSQQHNSNDIRSTLDNLALKDGLASPLIGYGGLRHMQGSPQSIAVGPTASCITCGQLEVGSTGQLWLLLINNGIFGTALYIGFFAYGAWRFRRDTTPYGLAGELVLLLTFIYLFAYNAVGPPLAFTMLAYALLWRNEREVLSPGAASDGGPAGRLRRAVRTGIAGGRQLPAGRRGASGGPARQFHRSG